MLYRIRIVINIIIVFIIFKDSLMYNNKEKSKILNFLQEQILTILTIKFIIKHLFLAYNVYLTY